MHLVCKEDYGIHLSVVFTCTFKQISYYDHDFVFKAKNKIKQLIYETQFNKLKTVDLSN